ncbi:hypothetical protein HZS_401, partial [Henneguya salminicola]
MKDYKCNRDGTLDCQDPTKDKKSSCLEDLITINPCNHRGVWKHYGNNTHLTYYCICRDKNIGNRCQHINNCVNCKVSDEKSIEHRYNCRA